MTGEAKLERIARTIRTGTFHMTGGSDSEAVMSRPAGLAVFRWGRELDRRFRPRAPRPTRATEPRS